MDRTRHLLRTSLVPLVGLGITLGCQPGTGDPEGTGGHTSSHASSSGGPGGTGGAGGDTSSSASSSSASSSSVSSSSASSSSGGGCSSPEVMCGAVCVSPATDKNNCGGCGHGCLGGMCAGGACQPIVLASGQAKPLGLSMDNVKLYWTNEQGGSVMSVSKSGGGTLAIATGQATPLATATDGTRVFWVTTNGGTLMSAPVGGGTAQTLASGLSSPSAVAVDASNVYWSDGAGISFMPKGGGTKTVISPQQTDWLVLDPSYVYFTSVPKSAMIRVPLLGGTETPLNSTLSSPQGPRIFGSFIYVGTGASVVKIPIAGGAATTVASDATGSVSSVASDGVHAYWTNSGAGSVESVPVAGGTVVGLAGNQNNPGYVLTDTAAIYWLDIAGGALMKLAK